MLRFSHTLKVNSNIMKLPFNKICNQFYAYTKKSFSEIKLVKESNLKGFIHYVRKNAFKYSGIDPLMLNNKKIPDQFQSDFWGISHLDQIESFPIDNTYNFNNTLLDKNSTVYELEKYLARLYLNNVGVEFEHIDNEEEKSWLYENYESIMEKETSNMELVNAFKLLYPADLFEKFLHTKFPTFKRYSGEGANTLLVLLYSILTECCKKDSQTNSAILAMPHRGRLNVLPLILDYPVANLLAKIQGKRDMPSEIEGIDDVVSHVAVTNDKLFCMDGEISKYKPIRVSLLHNPSHLEAINPVAMGKTYAKVQDNSGNSESVINITMHGDSALSAQGVIYESLSFHKSPKCDLGGTVHIVTNNQIGYTTQNENSRSSSHCTDIFKTYSIPIIHVNSDDIQALIKVGKLAYIYKQKFKKDFVVNLVCWRKYGHNEVDEPMFTQPMMYKCIKNKKESVELLKNYLLEKNLIDQSTVKSLEEKNIKILNDEFKRSESVELKIGEVRNEKFKGNKSLTHKWKSMEFPQFCHRDSELITGVKNTEEITNVLKSSVKLPDNFKVHPRLNQYFINGRLNLLQKGLVDWPGAEMAAFGTLLQDGFNVRISGQDVTRGTFSQRHIGLTDQETYQVYFPLGDKNNFTNLNARLEVNNSSLSEFAVMLFEYGYSWESPKNFVIWEAQFGDFVNGAQIALDQFLSSGEKKWMRQSGLTLLLPHGFDGTGPEHSSSKIERFLQLTDTNGINTLYDSSKLPDHRKINFCVAQPTKPSNYFHLLRRQMIRGYRKPLVVATPKIGLKHSAYVSKLDEFTSEYKFSPIIVDSFGNNQSLSQSHGIIFCSGQIFLEISKNIETFKKENNKVNHTLIRLEELAPFPELEIMEILQKNNLSSDANFYWIQEESMNMGCYSYVVPHLRRIMRNLGLKNNEIHYIGREAQCGAIGCVNDHKEESERLSEMIKNVIYS